MAIVTVEKTEYGTELYQWFVAGQMVDMYEVKQGERADIAIDETEGKYVFTFYNTEGKRVISWAARKFERIILPTGIGGLATQQAGPSTLPSAGVE